MATAEQRNEIQDVLKAHGEEIKGFIDQQLDSKFY